MLKPLVASLAPRTVTETAILLIDHSTIPSEDFKAKYPDFGPAFDRVAAEALRTRNPMLTTYHGAGDTRFDQMAVVTALVQRAFAAALATEN